MATKARRSVSPSGTVSSAASGDQAPPSASRCATRTSGGWTSGCQRPQAISSVPRRMTKGVATRRRVWLRSIGWLSPSRGESPSAVPCGWRISPSR